MSFKFDGWPWKTIGHLFCIISIPLVNSNCSCSPEMLNLVQNWQFSVLCDLEIWWMTLTNNRAPLLCYFKLCKSFQSHRWIQTGVTVRKRSIPLKISYICPCDLEISRMTLKNSRAPFLCYFKIWASFHSHLWIWTGVTVRKIPIWGQNQFVFSPVTLKFDG